MVPKNSVILRTNFFYYSLIQLKSAALLTAHERGLNWKMFDAIFSQFLCRLVVPSCWPFLLNHTTFAPVIQELHVVHNSHLHVAVFIDTTMA